MNIVRPYHHVGPTLGFLRVFSNMVAGFVILVRSILCGRCLNARKQDSLRGILETSYHTNLIICIYANIITTDTIRNDDTLINQR